MQRKNDETPKAGTNEVSNLSATSKELTMKSIATTESAIKQGMQVIKYNSDPVVTTEQLAAFYDADKKQISNNFLRNSTRFTAGKHFYKLQGDVLKDFKNQPSQRGLVNKKSSHLILWTERGAARHAKMLETNRAWDVYEQLEDCYFTQKEKIESPRKKTTVDERTPLRDAVNMLVGKKGLRYDDAYNMVHQRFAVDSIDELELSQIPMAVEYIHRVVLEGEYLGKQQELPLQAAKQFTDDELNSLCWLWSYATYMADYMLDVEPLLRVAEHRLAAPYYSMPRESVRIRNAARRILQRETSHIDLNQWQEGWRVLNRMRMNQLP